MEFLWYKCQNKEKKDNKKSTRRDSNPRPSPWQGDTPPLSHSCISFSVAMVNLQKKLYKIILGILRKHETGFEPATLALARRYSTTEPLVQACTWFSQAQVIYYYNFEMVSTLFFSKNRFFQILPNKICSHLILSVRFLNAGFFTCFNTF